MTEQIQVCHEHSGVIAEVTILKQGVKALWEKWDRLQMMLISSLAAAILNLVAVIFLLVRTFGG